MYICQRAATGTHLPVVAMAEWRNGRSWLRDPDDDDENSPVRAILYVTNLSYVSYQQTLLKQQTLYRKTAHSLSKVV